MATKDKRSTASAALPSNEAIWSGRKVSVPKAPKVERVQTRNGVPFRKQKKGKRK
jgi:hypothetical protein